MITYFLSDCLYFSLPLDVSIEVLIQLKTSSVILEKPPGIIPQDLLDPKLATPAAYMLETGETNLRKLIL